MCKGGKKTTETTTNTIDPEIKSLLFSNYNRASGIANTPFQPFAGESVADFTPTQLQAQDLLKQLGTGNLGDNTMNAAISAAQGAAGYNPTVISATPVDAPLLANTDLSPYMNPYQQDVIDATMKQLGQARDAGIMSDNQRATAASAFGGTRQAVLNSLTNKDYLNTAGSTLAGLNSQNFTNAQNAAESDLARRFAAATGNQNADLAAATANQNAAQGAAGINLNAAGLLGDLSGQQQSSALTKAGLVSAVGDAQQQLQQQKDNAAYQEFMRQIGYPAQTQQIMDQALGLFPNVINSTSDKTESGGRSFLTGLLGGLGSLGQGLGAMGLKLSDGDLKHDVRTHHFDRRGRRWVTFRYDMAPTDVHLGVIAQEVRETDPAAVHPTLFGLAVDYDQLKDAA